MIPTEYIATFFFLLETNGKLLPMVRSNDRLFFDFSQSEMQLVAVVIDRWKIRDKIVAIL